MAPRAPRAVRAARFGALGLGASGKGNQHCQAASRPSFLGRIGSIHARIPPAKELLAGDIKRLPRLVIEEISAGAG